MYTGGAISWRSHKQPIIAMSSTEAEYIAASDASREAIWLRYLLSELTSPLTRPTLLRCDNMSTIKLTSSTDVFHARTKHIDIRFHFIRWILEDKKIRLIYCPTEDMVADVLTKALPSPKVKHFASALGLRMA